MTDQLNSEPTQEADPPHIQMAMGNHSIGVFKDGKLIAADADVWKEADAGEGLVERLRELTPEITGKSYYWGKLVKEAADTIESLQRAGMLLNVVIDNRDDTIESLRRQVAELTLNHVESERQLRVWQDQVVELQDKLKLAELWRTGYEQAKADRIEAQKLGMQAMDENAALREWESRCAVALGVPGCNPEEMLHVIDNQREDAERYRWFRSKRLWDADQFPWPKDFEYPEPCLWDEGKMLDAAIDSVRKS